MNCIIIGNLDPATRHLKTMIDSVKALQLLAVCSDTNEAKKLIAERFIDLLFIDSDCIGDQYLKFIMSLSGKQKHIVTASSGQHAVKAFDAGAIDYLLKPFNSKRFLKAINKIGSQWAIENLNDPETGCFFVKSDKKFEKINPTEILYIEGLQNYITIRTHTKKIITYSSLKGIQNYLSEKEFLRVQKSFIVSISKIDSINSDDIIIGSTSIPISRTIKVNVLKTILQNRVYSYQA